MAADEKLAWVRMRGLEVTGVQLGVYASEINPRAVQVHVDILLPIGRAASTDQLADTLNYDELAHLTIETCRRKRYGLLESLADTLLTAIAAQFSTLHNIHQINLEVFKAHPPGVAATATTSVEVRWQRPS